MSKLPRISGLKAVKAFEKAGWTVVRISGSHHILRKSGVDACLSIPIHKGQNVGAGLLLSQIKAAKLTVEAFIANLD